MRFLLEFLKLLYFSLPAIQEMQEMWVWFLGQEDPLEEGIATHSYILS